MELPSLPDRPPERFQFHLKHLLAFMLASCFVALLVRLLVGLFADVPAGYLPSWVNTILLILAISGLGYFFLRVPFLMVSISRKWSRWQAVKAHQRELAEWAEARQSDSKRIMEESHGERGA
jgi:hypothetical protein